MVASLIVGEARATTDDGGGFNTGEISKRNRVSKPATRRRTDNRNRNHDLTQARRLDRKVVSTIQRVFSQYDESSEGVDAKLLVSDPPPKPEFPFIMVSLAFIKDIIDIPLELTLVGIILTTIFSLIIGAVLFIWCFGKINGGWWKKKIIRWLWTRYALTVILEFIPFIKIIPVTTIFIFMVHYKEKKLVKLANQVLEELKRQGLLSFI